MIPQERHGGASSSSSTSSSYDRIRSTDDRSSSSYARIRSTSCDDAAAKEELPALRKNGPTQVDLSSTDDPDDPLLQPHRQPQKRGHRHAEKRGRRHAAQQEGRADMPCSEADSDPLKLQLHHKREKQEGRADMS